MCVGGARPDVRTLFNSSYTIESLRGQESGQGKLLVLASSAKYYRLKRNRDALESPCHLITLHRFALWVKRCTHYTGPSPVLLCVASALRVMQSSTSQLHHSTRSISPSKRNACLLLKATRCLPPCLRSLQGVFYIP